MGSKINERLRAFRKSVNYSKKDMAELLGIKYTTYSRMEDFGNISGERLIEIAELFNIDVRKLLYDNIPQTTADNIIIKEPEVILGYKYLNQSVTIMENNFLKQLKRLSIKEQQEVYEIICKKALKEK